MSTSEPKTNEKRFHQIKQSSANPKANKKSAQARQLDLDDETASTICESYQEPPLYNIVFLNDNITPIDFVSSLLQKVFYFSAETAMSITMLIHNEGKAIVKTCPKDIAETKLNQIKSIISSSPYPLQCKIEKK